MRHRKVILYAVVLGLLLTLGWIVIAIIQERYLEAVAASCLGPALAWFALGMGKSDEE